MADASDHIHLTVSGRRLEVLVEGPVGAPGLVFHVGTPSAVVPFRPLSEVAARHGLRLIMWSRPGYGDSEPAHGRSVADIAGDATAVLDEFGISEFVTV